MLYCEDGEALESWQKRLRTPILGSVQSQAGWCSEQPSQVEGVLAHGRRIGTQ